MDLGDVRPATFAFLRCIAPRRAPTDGARRAATVSYEELTENTEQVLARIGEIEPFLADARADARLQVKDYAPQPLKNMNERQIGKLTEEQLGAISAGLAPYAEHVSALGYELRP